jgi:ankyrin repeat protein
VDDERQLLKAGANPSAKAMRITALSMAYGRGDAEAVEALLEAGADPNPDVVPPETSEDSISHAMPLLAHAVERGDTAFARRLLDGGAKPDYTALHVAIRKGNEEIVRLLAAAGVDIDKADFFGRRPVVWAYLNGAPSVARALLAAGADPNARLEKLPALSWALGTANRAAFEDLLAAGADPNARDEDKSTPLHHAARAGDADAVRALLAAGADPAVANRQGRTPLMEAARLGQVAIVELLLGAGVSPTAAHKKTTATTLAAEEGEEEVLRALGHSDPHRAPHFATLLGCDVEAVRARDTSTTNLNPPQKVTKDELMTNLERMFEARLPANRTVVLEGDFGRYYGLPREHADEKNRTATIVNPSAMSTAAIEEVLAGLGFAHLGDVACSKIGDVAVRLYICQEGDAYAVLNVGLMGQQTFDLVSRLTDGSFVTTTTAEAPSFPERRLFARVYPEAGPRVLLHKHRLRLAAYREHGFETTRAEARLEAAARWIDEFLLRRLGEWE